MMNGLGEMNTANGEWGKRWQDFGQYHMATFILGSSSSLLASFVDISTALVVVWPGH